jgi:hypothetical protein
MRVKLSVASSGLQRLQQWLRSAPSRSYEEPDGDPVVEDLPWTATRRAAFYSEMGEIQESAIFYPGTGEGQGGVGLVDYVYLVQVAEREEAERREREEKKRLKKLRPIWKIKET